MTRSLNVRFMDSVMQVYVHIEPQFMLESGKAHANFFIVKSRIAPLKKITILRLELLGNLVLVHLMNYVKIPTERDAQIDNIYYWTYSKMCLSWIGFEKSFNVFVGKRV